MRLAEAFKTLMVYKVRLLKVIADYRKYGSDPGKMATWNPRRSASVLKGAGSSVASAKKSGHLAHEAHSH